MDGFKLSTATPEASWPGTGGLPENASKDKLPMTDGPSK
jgi:hypothetical protein